MSPLLEWRNGVSQSCGIHQNCILYPLNRLQKKDTEDGLRFAVDIFLYNNAGHFTHIRSDPFKIPSRYPPSHGFIIDIDPSYKLNNKDIDVHFTTMTLCARWSGFNHHENVSLNIGVGTNSTNDNIYPFTPVSGQKSFSCLKSDKFSYNTRFFVLIRTVCSGGVTISSSNGVYIFNNNSVLNPTDIYIGERKETARKCVKIVNSSLNQFCLVRHLTIGSLYEISVETTTPENLTITSDDARIIKYNRSKVFYIVPYTETPCYQILRHYQNVLCLHLRKKESYDYVIEKHSLNVYIKENNYLSTLTPEWILFEHTDNRRHILHMSNSLHLRNSMYIQDKFTFENISLTESKSYSVGVKLCTLNSCSKLVESTTFVFEKSIIPGQITAEFTDASNENEVNVYIKVTPFEAKSGIILYQWGLSKGQDGNDEIIRWKTFDSSNLTDISVNYCYCNFFNNSKFI